MPGRSKLVGHREFCIAYPASLTYRVGLSRSSLLPRKTFLADKSQVAHTNRSSFLRSRIDTHRSARQAMAYGPRSFGMAPVHGFLSRLEGNLAEAANLTMKKLNKLPLSVMTVEDLCEKLRKAQKTADKQFDSMFGLHSASDPNRFAVCKRESLLWRISNELSILALRQIFEESDRRRQLELFKSVQDRVAHILWRELSTEIDASRRGRKPKYGKRDAKIYRLREGMQLSYGQIAQKLHMERLAVQAAYRREKELRDKLLKEWKECFVFFTDLKIEFPPPEV
jgi:hypothetical protein